MTRWLIIGIGNSLRRDDGVGPWLVERIEKCHAVRTRIVHQLTPELAADVAECDGVVFVDASRTDDAPRWIDLEPTTSSNRLGHALSPNAILGLTEQLFDRRPRGWLLAVPGHDFGFGEGCSLETEAMRVVALEMLRDLIANAGACPSRDREGAGDAGCVGIVTPSSGFDVRTAS
jgi:hydrogenase maturation protease